MNNNKVEVYSKLVLIVFFIISINLNAQKDTIYVDENDDYISKQVFYKKMNSPIYHGLRFDTDTLVLQTIRFKYYFGNLSSPIKSQLFKLLNKRHQIDTSKTLIIHYLDTLRAKSEYSKKNTVVFYDSLNRVIKPLIKSSQISDGVKFDFTNYNKVAKHKHIQNYRRFLKLNKKCTKRYYKYNNKHNEKVSVFHFYNVNNGHPNEFKELRWFKDYASLLKKLFFDENANTNFAIIKPSGEFLVYYPDKHFNNYHVTFLNLLNNETWNEIKISFEKEFETINKLN
ncbi:hypothetical protein MBM09_05925 [Flaviramulus sp. BrNp1-15]|uniref:hypothetical protein n=1 Tax=Flaviramulus sp. BrNp1-15 TaxID=2916754 RepID=UPI001EE8DE81|nr:hypothetical protein [Flaviramulus sp. BrNp1-15]ULC60526.1 hypothetical protein MBM09_05925 [Flaviramulus sp. BrNp1-15]